MAKPLSVLFVSSEVYPYVKFGELGDVSFSYTLAMRDLGLDIRVMAPKYGFVSERKNKIHEITRLREIPINMGPETVYSATVKSSSITTPKQKAQAYISANKTLFEDKKGLYWDFETLEEYPDNVQRFIFFAKTAIETCVRLEWYPDIIHCNDWQTALIPAVAKIMYPDEFKKTKFVLTIHNIDDMGLFPSSGFPVTGLPKEEMQYFKFKKQLSLLKAGVHYADAVTTVGMSYLESILKNKELKTLTADFAKKKLPVVGIYYALDKIIWNPKSDPFIAHKFNGEYFDFKIDNKKDLLNQIGLEYTEDHALIGVNARFYQSRGFEDFIEAIPKLLRSKIQLIVIGDGDKSIVDSFTKIAKKYPAKMYFATNTDEALIHKLYAGSDIFVYPKMNEGGALNIIYALQYGAIPVAPHSAGSMDWAHEYHTGSETGNGALYDESNPENIIVAVKKALDFYHKKPILETIIRNGMNSDYTWSRSAKLYKELYNNLLKEEKNHL